MSPEKLAYAANQIGKFFASQGFERSVDSIVDHLKKFWDPRMRTAILAHLDAGGSNLDPNVREAVRKLRTTHQARLELASAIQEERAHDDDRTGQH